VPHPNSKSPFEFTGGHLCLNFTNTVDNRKGDNRKELLTSYADLLQWAEEAGVLKARAAVQLQKMADEGPGQAKSVLRTAVQLREALLCAVFSGDSAAADSGRSLFDTERGLRNVR